MNEREEEKRKYFLERLDDHYINHTLEAFIDCVSGGGITDYDGFGEPYFLNRHTLTLEDSSDSLDLSLFVKSPGERTFQAVERIHRVFDNADRTIMGVFWYNK